MNRTALHFARAIGATDLVELLVKAGANENALDVVGHLSHPLITRIIARVIIVTCEMDCDNIIFVIRYIVRQVTETLSDVVCLQKNQLPSYYVGKKEELGTALLPVI